MNHLATPSAYGTLTEPTTLTIQRHLPGPIERAWAYLVESDLRRQWLAAGDMPTTPGESFTLTWRNDELTNPPGTRPEGMSAEHSATCELATYDPPNTLAFQFGPHGLVTITLEAAGTRILLTLTHARLLNRNTTLNVSAGWHMHLDLLVARTAETEPQPFWDGWARLKTEYTNRLPG
jgi:uncharacterized protein YndB with AHSA1/START domain